MTILEIELRKPLTEPATSCVMFVVVNGGAGVTGMQSYGHGIWCMDAWIA